jgi:hypothetical protein
MSPQTISECIRQAWFELRERKGSLADAPLPSGLSPEALLPHISELEQETIRLTEAWIAGEPFPPLPPGLNRLLELRFGATYQLVGSLSNLGVVYPMQGKEQLLRFLLIELYAESTQDALDNTLIDILGVEETQ